MQPVFDNDSFVAVDKPAGWLSIPGRLGDDPRPVLGRELEKQLGARLWPVHRLDAEVSGLVLYAKHEEAHRAANAWFEAHAVAKTYQAVTEVRAAAPPPPLGSPVEWRSRLLRGKKRAYESPHGKEAVTRATLVAVRGGRSYWSLQPLTGRPHQLRFHLASHDHPIVGDALYGATGTWEGGGIALRAVALDLSRCDGALELGVACPLAVPPLF